MFCIITLWTKLWRKKWNVSSKKIHRVQKRSNGRVGLSKLIPWLQCQLLSDILSWKDTAFPSVRLETLTLMKTIQVFFFVFDWKIYSMFQIPRTTQISLLSSHSRVANDFLTFISMARNSRRISRSTRRSENAKSPAQSYLMMKNIRTWYGDELSRSLTGSFQKRYWIDIALYLF